MQYCMLQVDSLADDAFVRGVLQEIQVIDALQAAGCEV